MKNARSKQISKSDGIATLKFSTTSILVPLAAIVILAFVTWGQIQTIYIYNWVGLALAAVLAGLLRQAIFMRKSEEYLQDLTKWKTNFAYFASITSAIFAVGYSYGAMASTSNTALLLAVAMVMHMSCIALSCLGSKRIFVTSMLVLVMPFAVTLLTLNSSTMTMLAIGLLVFSAVLIMFNLVIHRSIIDGFEIMTKQSQQLELSEESINNFESFSFKDSLTGIFNRRFFDFMISEEVRRTKRAGSNLSIAIIEIDFFNTYAEHYGEDQGDQCIISIAEILTKVASRGSEFITRFEHDKFAIITPNVSTSEVLAFASKMIDMVDNANLENKHSLITDSQTVSISVGISEFKSDNIIDVSGMITQALDALNTARLQGYSNAQAFSVKPIAKENVSLEKEKNDISNEDCEVV
jgi:diguanylate cyclase (GGDEF)-like protein